MFHMVQTCIEWNMVLRFSGDQRSEKLQAFAIHPVCPQHVTAF
jgi:hypothetical protein